jgi:hypothetical protein
MGPAQFIPSTWMLVKDKLSNALGISSMPNPWNAQHAFMAASMHLSDLGASNQTFTAERNAACRYFSGKSCPASGWITDYATGVIRYAENIQKTKINLL